MARSGIGSNFSPISIPPFTGATRPLLVWNILCFFALAILSFVSGPVMGFIVRWLGFSPLAVVHGEVWQLATYSFLNFGFINSIFAMMSLWYVGIFLESNFGPRW